MRLAAPIVVVHVCYLLSAHYGYVDKCNPYIEGCTSISATGRHGPSYFLFKAGTIGAVASASGNQEGGALKALSSESSKHPIKQ